MGLAYNVQQLSGVMFQVVADVRRKKKPVMDVLAAGGRYDSLVNTSGLHSINNSETYKSVISSM